MKANVARSALDIALSYIERGWSPLPVPHREKGCVVTGWPGLRITTDTAPHYFNGAAQNIGVVTGAASRGLLDIDLDHPLARILAPAFLAKTDTTFGRKSNPESHREYQAEDDGPLGSVQFADPSPGAGEKAMLVELRADGGQTVFPGSVHESGEPIEWVRSGEPARTTYADLKKRVGALAAATLIAKRWREGVRNELSIALIGYLQRKEWDAGDIEKYITVVAKAAGDEELGKRLARIGKLKNVPGRKKLVEIIGKAVVEKFEEWMGFKAADVIQLRAGALHESVDQSIAALGRHADTLQLYQRGERLVRPRLVEAFGFPDADGTRPATQALRIKELTSGTLRVELSRLVRYSRFMGTGEKQHETAADCPKDVATAVFESSDRWADIPAIDSVSEVPLYDGRRLYCGPGVKSGVYVAAPTVALPDALSKKAASAALARIDGWLDEFQYADISLDGSALLALMMTAALRPSLPVAPGFIITKHAYGAGATTAAKVAGIIATGREPAVMPCSDEEELRKQLTASLIAGDQLRILDNLPDGTELRSSLLAQIVSEPSAKVRVLGESTEINCPTASLVIVTGVNVQTAADLNRRFMRIRLDPKVADPEARSFKRKALLQELARERVSVLRDLFTITASYIAAAESEDVGELAGYEHWVRWVAQPLKWLGRANVLHTVSAATAADPMVEMLRRLIPLISKLCELLGATAGVRVSEMIASDEFDNNSDRKVDAHKVRGELRTALGEATAAKRFQNEWQLDTRVIGRWFARHHGRIVVIENVGQRIAKGPLRDGSQVWQIESVQEGTQ